MDGEIDRLVELNQEIVANQERVTKLRERMNSGRLPKSSASPVIDALKAEIYNAEQEARKLLHA